jgi:nitroreductase
MLNDLTSPATLVATRRSGKPRDMVEPAPDEAQMARILGAAMRVPDHGKIAPWRFVVIGAEQRPAFAALLERAYRADKPEPGRLELEAVRQFALQAPALVVVFSTPKTESHIPLWEQELSAGAACTTLLYAAHAEGFVGGWLTGWAAYSPMVAEALGHPGGRIAGFVFLGTAGREPEERPRPDFEAVVSHWKAEQA